MPQLQRRIDGPPDADKCLAGEISTECRAEVQGVAKERFDGGFCGKVLKADTPLTTPMMVI